MPTYSLFAAPVLGMQAHTSAFSAISQNLTNVNTGGYKATDTRFSTVLANTFGANRDVGGLRTINQTFVSTQGAVVSTTNALDVAIDGKGMFVTNSQLDGTGDTFYTRDGAFQKYKGPETITVTGASNPVAEEYLVDKNGNFLQGIEPDTNGDFSASGTLVPVRIDTYKYSGTSTAINTTLATLSLNLPATKAAGETETVSGSVYTQGETDTTTNELIPGSNLRQFDFTFTRLAANNSWQLDITHPNGTVTGGSTTLLFDSSGNLSSGSNIGTLSNGDLGITIGADWAPVTNSNGAFDTDPTTSGIEIDLSDLTSIGTEKLYFNFQRENGQAAGELTEFGFDNQGHIFGRFTNGDVQNLYQIPLATFANADALTAFDGNRYAESVDSGSAQLVLSQEEGFATFTPNAHELSNVNLQNEFTKIIRVQQAYNLSATTFKTADEMTQTATELKA